MGLALDYLEKLVEQHNYSLLWEFGHFSLDGLTWLDLFRFGPLEWLWHSLSYMKFQPMRKP